MMKTNMLAFLCLIGVFLPFRIASSEVDKKTVSYIPKNVELSGEIFSKQYFGLPNFGETPKIDAKMTGILLRLDSPIDVIANRKAGDDEDSFYNVEYVQVVNFTGKMIDICLGSHVVLSGELFEFDTGVALTKVGFGVERIVEPNKSIYKELSCRARFEL